MNHFTRRVAAWIACCAMLFAALAPSLAHAVSAARGEAWTEICSPGGIKMVKVAGDYSQLADADAADHGVMKHCAMCATASAGPALPPGAAPTIFLIDPDGASHPLLFYQSRHPLAIWTPSQSRAPPALG